MKSYNHVLSFVRDRPWAVLPSVLSTVHEIVGLRLRGVALDEDSVRDRLDDAAAANGPRRGGRTSGDVAVIPVYGMLLPKYDLMAAMSGATGMDVLRADIKAAVADPDIATIVLDVDSPGGIVDMIPETAALLREARAQKPLIGVVNTMAASAAYWLLAQADEIVASPSAVVGSIGVYTLHEDLSGAYEQAGVSVSVISAGKYKAEDNEFEPLSDEAREHLQNRVDEAYEMFVDDVARGRGVKASEVRAGYGEGQVLRVAAGKDAGLIDRVGTLDETVARVLKRPPRSRDGSRAMAAGVLFEDGEPTDEMRELARRFDAGEFADTAAEPPAVDPSEPDAEPVPDPAFDFQKELLERRAVRR